MNLPHYLALGLVAGALAQGGCAHVVTPSPAPAHATLSATPPPPTPAPATSTSHAYDVRNFGAKGDGKTLDTTAINQAIAAASAAGGGTVYFSAGTYLSYSIHLQSNIALFLDQGAILQAADAPAAGQPGYDASEPNHWGDLQYQDYGHSHFHNSLIWGENLQNIAILGTGTIYGEGLLRDGGQRAGLGNKSIALKLCRNVTLRDFTIAHGGWFALLATGVDNLNIENIKVDTNRDGFDIDCCHNVHVSNCSINSPRDDGLCLKSTFALGYARTCENISITNCQVSGFDEGSFLNGTYLTTQAGPTGRIKFGTESNGGFRNITISNCVFVHCRGLAIESVDGGLIEDVTINNLAMEDIINSPIFIRLGQRMRGPKTDAAGNATPLAIIRRVNISNVVASNVAGGQGVLIEGTIGHPIQDVRLSNLRIDYNGGGTAQQAANRPVENEPQNYPEPGSFGTLPSYGLFARHVTGLSLSHVAFSVDRDDLRPPFQLEDVAGATFEHVTAPSAPNVHFFHLMQVTDFSTEGYTGLPNTHRDTVTDESL